MKKIKSVIIGIILIVLAYCIGIIESGLQLKDLNTLISYLLAIVCFYGFGFGAIYYSLSDLCYDAPTLNKAGNKFIVCIVCIAGAFICCIFLIAAGSSNGLTICVLALLLVFTIWFFMGIYLLHKGLYLIALNNEDMWMMNTCSKSWVLFVITNILIVIIGGVLQYTGQSKSTATVNYAMLGLEIVLGILMYSVLIRVLLHMMKQKSLIKQQDIQKNVRLWSIRNIGAKLGFICTVLLIGISILSMLAVANYSDKYDFEYEAYVEDPYDGIQAYNELNKESKIDITADNLITLTKYTGDRKNIVIPAEIDGKKVVKIGEAIFKNNTSIRKIKIEEGISCIGYDAFSGAYYLNEVDIPESVVSIGDAAFELCYCLEELELPKNLQSIESITFLSTSLRRLTIPGTVKVIEEHAFLGCRSLEEVIMEEGVEQIDKAVFYGCEALETVRLPLSLSSIGESAFMNCSKLEEVKLPDKISDIYCNSFLNTPWMDNQKDEFLIIGDGILLRYTGNKEIIDVPDEVKKIGNKAFGNYGDNERPNDNYLHIKKIVLHDNISSIGKEAFSSCVELKEINLPEGITHIGDGAFSYCRGLETIKIPNGVDEIGDSLFMGCESLKDIILPNDIEFIGYKMFNGCTSIETIKIPGSTTQIGYEAFADCTKLKQLEIPKSIQYIRKNAFSGTPWYEDNTEEFMIVGDGVLIKYNGNPKPDSDVIIPEGTKTLPDGILQEYLTFHSLTIPKNVEWIDEQFLWNPSGDNEIPTIEEIIVLEPSVTVDFGGCDYNGVLKSYKDSETEKYAKQEGIAFEVIQ